LRRSHSTTTEHRTRHSNMPISACLSTWLRPQKSRCQPKLASWDWGRRRGGSSQHATVDGLRCSVPNSPGFVVVGCMHFKRSSTLSLDLVPPSVGWWSPAKGTRVRHSMECILSRIARHLSILSMLFQSCSCLILAEQNDHSQQAALAHPSSCIGKTWLQNSHQNSQVCWTILNVERNGSTTLDLLQVKKKEINLYK
jgi:hypothetical protein